MVESDSDLNFPSLPSPVRHKLSETISRTFASGIGTEQTLIDSRPLSLTGMEEFVPVQAFQPPLREPIFDGAVEEIVNGTSTTWVFRGSHHTLEGLDVMICDGKTLAEVITAMPNANREDLERVYRERKLVIDRPNQSRNGIAA